eukprot:5376044-Ditylum_brightwellii.AAC.1
MQRDSETIRGNWVQDVKEGRVKSNCPLSLLVGCILSDVNKIHKGKVVPKDYNTPPIDVIDDEQSVQIKKKMFNAIKECNDPENNLHERDLKFLNKPDFLKFMYFGCQFRNAVMEQILKPVLKKCLPNCGASADT